MEFDGACFLVSIMLNILTIGIQNLGNSNITCSHFISNAIFCAECSGFRFNNSGSISISFGIVSFFSKRQIAIINSNFCFSFYCVTVNFFCHGCIYFTSIIGSDISDCFILTDRALFRKCLLNTSTYSCGVECCGCLLSFFGCRLCCGCIYAFSGLSCLCMGSRGGFELLYSSHTFLLYICSFRLRIRNQCILYARRIVRALAKGFCGRNSRLLVILSSSTINLHSLGGLCCFRNYCSVFSAGLRNFPASSACIFISSLVLEFKRSFAICKCYRLTRRRNLCGRYRSSSFNTLVSVCNANRCNRCSCAISFHSMCLQLTIVCGNAFNSCATGHSIFFYQRVLNSVTRHFFVEIVQCCITSRVCLCIFIFFNICTGIIKSGTRIRFFHCCAVCGFCGRSSRAKIIVKRMIFFAFRLCIDYCHAIIFFCRLNFSTRSNLFLHRSNSCTFLRRSFFCCVVFEVAVF